MNDYFQLYRMRKLSQLWRLPHDDKLAQEHLTRHTHRSTPLWCED